MQAENENTCSSYVPVLDPVDLYLMFCCSKKVCSPFSIVDTEQTQNH